MHLDLSALPAQGKVVHLLQHPQQPIRCEEHHKSGYDLDLEIHLHHESSVGGTTTPIWTRLNLDWLLQTTWGYLLL